MDYASYILSNPYFLPSLVGAVAAVVIAAMACRVYGKKAEIRRLELQVEREKLALVREDMERRRIFDMLLYLPEDPRLMKRVTEIRTLITKIAEKYVDVETKLALKELKSELRRLEDLSKRLDDVEEGNDKGEEGGKSK